MAILSTGESVDDFVERAVAPARDDELASPGARVSCSSASMPPSERMRRASSSMRRLPLPPLPAFGL